MFDHDTPALLLSTRRVQHQRDPTHYVHTHLPSCASLAFSVLHRLCCPIINPAHFSRATTSHTHNHNLDSLAEHACPHGRPLAS